jgi:hypothetical protein
VVWAEQIFEVVSRIRNLCGENNLKAMKNIEKLQKESSDPDLNEGPVDLQSTALTPELPEQLDVILVL